MLGIVYSDEKKYDDAIAMFQKARTILPIYSAALTQKLAVIYYQAGKKDDALKELEGAREQARVELLPDSKGVFLALGMLYDEMGRNSDARGALNEYLRLTAAAGDPSTLANRKQAQQKLDSLK